MFRLYRLRAGGFVFRMQASIASLWDIKEALGKVLDVVIGGRLAFHDTCVYKDFLGRPCVSMLDERVSRLEEESGYKIRGIKVSLSHDAPKPPNQCHTVQ